ncbi:MAG: hypothetical protein A4S12_08125 [Proteobacteria bacterium SG_bin5]|nr:MAG: hypothetical protein A4S12_08125 [Proteobacteria bacterium SG_bin5]
MSDPARGRFFLIALVQSAGFLGAAFGVVLVARAEATPAKLLGIALVLAALWTGAVVPRALARRWRSKE